MRICGRGLPTHQIIWKSEKNFLWTYGRTDGWTHLSSNLLGHRRGDDLTIKPRKGAAVIAASMHGFASCRKFKSTVTLTLTLDRVKVISTYAVYVGLPAYPTM